MTQVKFLADSMLGRLARWLRLMGYYVEYAKSNLDDIEIIRRCKQDELFLLSRDKELCSRYKPSMYMESDRHFEQLRAVISRFHPDETLYFTICPICNGVVEKQSISSCSEKLPDSVRERFDYVYICQVCGKVYWEGSHFEAILGTIKDLENDI